MFMRGIPLYASLANVCFADRMRSVPKLRFVAGPKWAEAVLAMAAGFAVRKGSPCG
jgi:hypothetical protein